MQKAAERHQMQPLRTLFLEISISARLQASSPFATSQMMQELSTEAVTREAPSSDQHKSATSFEWFLQHKIHA